MEAAVSVLVHAYADDWGADELPAGKAMWFRLNTDLEPPLAPRKPRRSTDSQSHKVTKFLGEVTLRC